MCPRERKRKREKGIHRRTREALFTDGYYLPETKENDRMQLRAKRWIFLYDQRGKGFKYVI